jgi:NAD(P)-dependent dehydrogenase (short-subunit alcohol dehydrogenase family)
MDEFKNKVVVITGGNSGIGYASAKSFKAKGATVVITGRRKEALEKAAAELGVKSFVSDQSKLEDIGKLAALVAAEYKRVDTLVVNAGVGAFKPIELFTESEFDYVMNTNFKGAFFTLKHFIPLLNNGAAVTLVSSNAAALSMPTSSAYTASKAALNAFMRVAAVELGPRKIRVNAVSPGPTDTEMTSKFGLDSATLQAMKENIISKIPLSKIGTAEDVASLIVYLSNDRAASFINGAEFFIDGGLKLT